MMDCTEISGSKCCFLQKRGEKNYKNRVNTFFFSSIRKGRKEGDDDAERLVTDRQ